MKTLDRSSVRLLNHADAPPYRALMLRAYAEEADAFTSTPEERAQAPLQWWCNRICNAEQLTQAFGWFDGDALVGTAAVEYNARVKTRHKGLVIGMFVASGYRGRGAGSALLNAVVAHARSREGLVALTLTVTEGNAPAIALYEASGFTVFGSEPLAIRTDKGFRGKLHMQRLLQDHFQSF